MFKEIGLAFALCGAGAVQAATVTYTFEEEDGEYLDAEYGGREDIRSLYDQEIALNQFEYDYCLLEGFGGCETALQFEDYRVRGYLYSIADGPMSFEDYYQIHFEEALANAAVDGWTSDGMTVIARSFGGLFPYGRLGGSYLGSVIDGGESIGPAAVSITIPDDQRLVAIDLSFGPSSLGGIFSNELGTSRIFTAGYQGTFFFDSAFDSVQTFVFSVGPVDPSDLSNNVGVLSYDNLVTELRAGHPTPVPLPAPIALLGFGLFGLGTVRAARSRRGS